MHVALSRADETLFHFLSWTQGLGVFPLYVITQLSTLNELWNLYGAMQNHWSQYDHILCRILCLIFISLQTFIHKKYNKTKLVPLSWQCTGDYGTGNFLNFTFNRSRPCITFTPLSWQCFSFWKKMLVWIYTCIILNPWIHKPHSASWSNLVILIESDTRRLVKSLSALSWAQMFLPWLTEHLISSPSLADYKF